MFKSKKKNKKKSFTFFKSPSLGKRSSSFNTFLLIFFILFVFGFIYVSINQPITSINIEGDLKRVSKKGVEIAVLEIKNKGFLTVNQGEYKDKLEAIDWVKSVKINKQWPNTINVVVVEDDVIALWNKRLLLNSSGELYALDQRDVPDELIQFSGPEDRENEVYRRYKLYNDELVRRGILIEEIELDLRGSWVITVRPSIKIKLGEENTEERFERFLTIWDQSLLENFELISYIDLRYSEGFVIKRKNQ